MLLKDNLHLLRGEVLLRVLDTQGRCLWRHHDKNTITYMAPVILMDLLTQSDVDADGVQISIGGSHPGDAARGFSEAETAIVAPLSNALRYMRVGTGNGAAVRGEFVLNNPVEGVAGAALISAISFPTNASVMFTALFGANAANVNDPIQEVSLWTRGVANSLLSDAVGSRMFARQIHPAVVKTDVIQLEYTWTIFFT